jgi:hypothetical protein
MTCGRWCQILSNITALCYPTFTATSRLKSESFSDKTYWPYQNQPQCIWQLKSCSFERSILNCHRFNSNCVLKAGLLSCKTFDFLKTRKSDCTLDAIHFISMATGHNRFSVTEELSLHAFWKIASPVSPRRRYPDLPDLSDNPLPSYIAQ